MKICHITSVHPRYDIRIFVNECCYLAKQFEGSLIVADSLGNERKNDVSIYDIGKPIGGRLRRMRDTAVAIYNKVLQLNPQVIHFHDPELIGIGQKLTKLGYKVIYDVHEDVPKQILNKPWIPKLVRPLVSKLVELKERIASAQFAGIICATEIIASRFKQYNLNTLALHNYPILSELMHISSDWGSRTNNLCYLGSISETRGIIPLINSLVESNLTLDLAGPYSNNNIEFAIQQSIGYPKVYYHGILNRTQVAELLATVKIGIVTLLPTPSYVESLPIKLLEYMLAGIPVVTSNFKLWEAYVKDNNCGLMVDPEDSSAIAVACKYLVDNQNAAKLMGERGREAVINSYTWEIEVNKLYNFYSSL